MCESQHDDQMDPCRDDRVGCSRAIGRFGIDRRVFAAGENKARMDAFRPLSFHDERKANT